MVEPFSFDVFLSHSSKDKAVVRAIAERLRTDGLRVWFDEWVIKPGDSIPVKIEEGLEHSRVLVLCMSANAFGSDWAQLESQTFRFRDPLNKERRFIPLRLDDAPIRGSLAQFLYIDWDLRIREPEYRKLIEACKPHLKEVAAAEPLREQAAESTIRLESKNNELVHVYAFTSDGERVVTGSADKTVRVWEMKTGRGLLVLNGHVSNVEALALSPDQRYVLSGALDGQILMWDVKTGRQLGAFDGHTQRVRCVSWSNDQRYALSGAEDQTVRVWDLEKGNCIRILEGHTDEVWSVAWSTDQRYALSGAGDRDNTIRSWEIKTGRCLQIFEGHTADVYSVAWSSNQRRALSGSYDSTLRLWDVTTGHCLRTFNVPAHVWRAAWSPDETVALAATYGKTLSLWDVETGNCLRVLENHPGVRSVAWSADGRRAFSGDDSGGIRVWDLSDLIAKTPTPTVTPPVTGVAPDQIQYTNAKVLLVGESGVGKTGLSKVLAGEKWQPSDSTVGAWATQ